jgi:hypothetical protein
MPAADEQETIAAALHALRRATRHLRRTHPAVTARVFVVLDNCFDATAPIVATFPEVDAAPVAARCVGIARDAGTRAALSGLSDLSTVWTAHTDADSQVALDWLSTMVRAADEGVDLFLGTVRPAVGLPASVHSAWLTRHGRADGHRHVHGANLGIRASVLEAVGGWPHLRSGEDVELASRVRAVGAAVRSSGSAPVRTSTRLVGRAPNGYADYLATLARELHNGYPEERAG